MRRRRTGGRISPPVVERWGDASQPAVGVGGLTRSFAFVRRKTLAPPVPSSCTYPQRVLLPGSHTDLEPESFLRFHVPTIAAARTNMQLRPGGRGDLLRVHAAPSRLTFGFQYHEDGGSDKRPPSIKILRHGLSRLGIKLVCVGALEDP